MAVSFFSAVISNAALARSIPEPVLKYRSQPISYTDFFDFVVKRGNTLDEFLNKAKINSNDRVASIRALRPYFSPSSIKLGQVVEIYYLDNNKSRELSSMRINISRTEFVEVQKLKNGQFDVIEGVVPLKSRLVAVKGTINSTLFGAAQKKGISTKILHKMIKLLSYDVDFQRDIRKGDEFTILYEKKYDNSGEYIDSGNIYYLSLNFRKSNIEMYRFTDKKGDSYYFNSQGESVRKSLLATPVDGFRISSGFGMRKHPILGYNKMHKGIDFAAPRGTPIYAAGNGVIERIGRNGGYGNYIRINHGKGYATAYAHMKRFGRGMRKGKKVKQGDVIGYVGTTGRSTGPHLHYEVLINGKQTNPQSIKTTPGKKLKGISYGIFAAHKRKVKKLVGEML